MTTDNHRVSLHRRVSRDTMKLLRELSKSLELSQGAVIDRAVAALAVAESFGSEHLRLKSSPLADAVEAEHKRLHRAFNQPPVFEHPNANIVSIDASRSGGRE